MVCRSQSVLYVDGDLLCGILERDLFGLGVVFCGASNDARKSSVTFGRRGVLLVKVGEFLIVLVHSATQFR